ncbi:hypothetical protein TRFO_14103 [Tritrichomonas foetus]|uniref:Anaphase-promoting complex subunit 4 WD40 domain-containing protein n=1 Tax=Tritrichomonas foetus TaxID=1144522 RepID=A0A1J4KVV5_9EUKA|nr:hypothetical protein TRFO_14103 [Tritrichomonas foetus]|eukprot:OHT15359.1 hypothetical protein TRFO_14103 [Tritrichomonas foetus]
MTIAIPGVHIHSFDIDPTANFLFCVSTHDFYIFDIHTFETLGIIRLNTKKSISSFNYSAKSKTIVLTTQDKNWLYSLDTGNLLFELESPGRDYCTTALFSPDCRFFGASYNDGHFLILNGQTMATIKEFKFEHAIVMFSFSSGSQFVILGFDNGKMLILGTETDHKYLRKVHDKNSCVITYFHPHNFMKFMTKDSKKGIIKFFEINKYNEIEEYRNFNVNAINKNIRLIAFAFSCDGTILFGCSGKKLFAWRMDDATILHKIEFDVDYNLEIDSFCELIPHLLIPNVVLVIAKSSLWIWDCLSNDCRIVSVANEDDPLFQSGNWFKLNTAIIQTNKGILKLFGCEEKEWNSPEIRLNDYTEWSPVFSQLLSQWKEPNMNLAMTAFEKRAIHYLPINEVELNSDSDSY